MTITKTTKDIWITSDSLEFDSEEMAQRHESLIDIAGGLYESIFKYSSVADAEEIALWILANYDVVRKERV